MKLVVIKWTKVFVNVFHTVSRVKVSPAEKIKFMVQIQNTAGYYPKKATATTTTTTKPAV